MSELDYEEPPEVYVPKVRDWVGPAFEAWTRGVFPPRRSTVIVGGCLFLPIYGFFVLLKLGIYAAGIVLMLFANVVWIVAELATYHYRLKQAQLEAWTNYMIDLHDGGDEA